MNKLIAAIMLLFFALPLSAQEWIKVAEEYEKNMEYLKQREAPSLYSFTNYRGDVLSKKPSPELCIGVHLPDQKAVDDLKELGIRCVRFTIYWNDVEPEKNKYSPEALEHYDRIFGVLLKNGMVPAPVIHGNPPFVSFRGRGTAYRDFADFAAMCASRWKECRYWELWNEMDSDFTDLFGAKDSRIPQEARGRYYAEMLKTAYPAVKKANPRAIVVMGGVAGSITDFMRGVYKAGGRGYFDIMNIHTYGMPLAWSFVNRGLEAKRVMDAFGDGTKPVWNTEFGTEAGSYVAAWGKPESLSSFDDIQADYLTELARLNKETALYDKCFIFQYLAASEGGKEAVEELGGDPEDYTYGIMRSDGSPRPAFEALKRLAINKDLFRF
ncbi:MAG: cellulase family glycosylhydrolase [Abditibacteriota bacterium]|nr:cellulase family glycosylhydrolase [Abditibacteriota bacterium]